MAVRIIEDLSRAYKRLYNLTKPGMANGDALPIVCDLVQVRDAGY